MNTAAYFYAKQEAEFRDGNWQGKSRERQGRAGQGRAGQGRAGSCMGVALMKRSKSVTCGLYYCSCHSASPHAELHILVVGSQLAYGEICSMKHVICSHTQARGVLNELSTQPRGQRSALLSDNAGCSYRADW